MLIRCKKGVFFKYINEHFFALAQIVYDEYQKEYVVPVVTSACDGRHMRTSFHYVGLGWDWRIWGLPNPGDVADRIRKRAREISPRYDIVFGDSNHLDHIHTEYDIRKPV